LPKRQESTARPCGTTSVAGCWVVPSAAPGGHRLYDDQAVVTLRVIKAAQRLGFTLDEVADLIEVGRRRGRDSGLQARASAKLAKIEDRINDLQLIRANLVAAVAAGCDDLHECATSDCCPIPFVDLAQVRMSAR
jgi:DNA-binding transcriptional MerR regulator